MSFSAWAHILGTDINSELLNLFAAIEPGTISPHVCWPARQQSPFFWPLPSLRLAATKAK
jgi:hypothetical protein